MVLCRWKIVYTSLEELLGFWRAICPMRPGPRNRSEPILKINCQNWITGSRYKQGSHPRNFRRWEPCFYAAQISHRSGMESRVGLQYNDPVILLFTILEEIQYDLS